MGAGSGLGYRNVGGPTVLPQGPDLSLEDVKRYSMRLAAAHVPGTSAAEDELLGIGAALAAAGSGVFELAPCGIMGEDLAAPDFRQRLQAAAVQVECSSGQLMSCANW